MVWIVVGVLLAVFGGVVLGLLGWRLWRKVMTLAKAVGRATDAVGDLPPRPSA